MCFSKELEKEKRRKMNQPGCCSPVLEMHLQAFHKQTSTFGPGGAGGCWGGMAARHGEAGCCMGKVSPCFSAGEGQLLGSEGFTAARSETQLAAAVCCFWSEGVSETL